jgi:Cu/Ag efflux pump CusA
VEYVFVDISGRDVGSYAEEARKLVGEQLDLPPSYVLQWSGQDENMLRVRERLKIVVPITLMTVAAAFMGLLPILWSISAGADVMKRIAAPTLRAEDDAPEADLVAAPRSCC